MLKRIASIFAMVMFSLLPLSSADAYVRSTTCGSYVVPCEDDEEPIPIYWPSSCFVIHLNERGTVSIDRDDVEWVTEQSIKAWAEVECSYSEPIFGGLTNEEEIGYDTEAAVNVNALIFRDNDWPHVSGVLGLTSVTYDRSTGIIVDADIEFNTADFDFTSIDNPLLTKIDLQNTMVHEMGHVMGLDHTSEEEATMFASAPIHELKKRTLHQDDIDGLCEAYPFADKENAHACDDSSVGYFDVTKVGKKKEEDDCGCRVRVAKRASLPALSLLVLVGALWLRRERKGARG